MNCVRPLGVTFVSTSLEVGLQGPAASLSLTELETSAILSSDVFSVRFLSPLLQLLGAVTQDAEALMPIFQVFPSLFHGLDDSTGLSSRLFPPSSLILWKGT